MLRTAGLPRILIDIDKADVNWKRMQRCQDDASKGLYALLLADFLAWLAHAIRQGPD